MAGMTGQPAGLCTQNSLAGLLFAGFFLLIKAEPHQVMCSVYKGSLPLKLKVCRITLEPPAQVFSPAVTISNTSTTAENPEGNHSCDLQSGGRELPTQGQKHTKKSLVPRAEAKKHQCPATTTLPLWLLPCTRVSAATELRRCKCK